MVSCNCFTLMWNLIQILITLLKLFQIWLLGASSIVALWQFLLRFFSLSFFLSFSSVFFYNAFILSVSTTACSGLLYISCPHLNISNFPKDPWSLSLENFIRKQGQNTIGELLTLVAVSWQSKEISLHIYLLLYIILFIKANWTQRVFNSVYDYMDHSSLLS